MCKVSLSILNYLNFALLNFITMFFIYLNNTYLQGRLDLPLAFGLSRKSTA